MNPVKWETVKQFMHRVGVGRGTTFSLIKSGLPTIQIGGKGRRIRIDPTAADIWLIQHFGSTKKNHAAHPKHPI